MKKINYLIRLDDASPFMNTNKWSIIEKILLEHNISPLVGIIPNNEDFDTIYENENINFWKNVNDWVKNGWDIALHGYNHLCNSQNVGINPMYNRSEFAGLDYDLQVDKIIKGLNVLKTHNLNPIYFFAPSHTFDLNTLIALYENSNIKFISDTIAIKPYFFNNFIFIPQQFGKFRNIKLPGYWTFCFHPNTMSSKEFLDFEKFIIKNRSYFASFKDIEIDYSRKYNILDKIFKYLYFKYKYLKSFK